MDSLTVMMIRKAGAGTGQVAVLGVRLLSSFIALKI